MVIEIFVTQSQAIQALAQQSQPIVLTTGLPAGIIDHCCNGSAQTQPLIDLLQQQHAAITGDVATVKPGFNPAALTGWKGERLLGTFCHGQSLVRIQLKQLNLIELHGLCPFHWCNIAARQQQWARNGTSALGGSAHSKVVRQQPENSAVSLSRCQEVFLALTENISREMPSPLNAASLRRHLCLH